MISLGCAKIWSMPRSCSEVFCKRGMEITSDADEADVLVVNTCAFIDSAKEESIEAILEAHQQRGLGKKPGQKLIVSGACRSVFRASSRVAAGSRRFHRPGPGERNGRDRRAMSCQRATGRSAVAPRLQLRHRPADLHSGLRYAAVSAHPGASAFT